MSDRLRTCLGVWGVLVALGVLCAAARGDGLLLLAGGGDSQIDNLYFFGKNKATPHSFTANVVLTATNPALLGLGPQASEVRFPSDSSVTGDAISTTNVGTDASIDRPCVSGLTVDGQHAVSEQTLDGVADVANGIHLAGTFLYGVTNCTVKNFYGDAIKLRQGGLVRGCRAGRSFTGINVIGADAMVIGNIVDTCRDYCIEVNGGNFSSSGNHYYGAADAALILQAGASYCTFTGDIFNDANAGIAATSGNNCSFANCKIAQNYGYAVNIDQYTSGIHLTDCLIRVNKSTSEHANCKGVYINGVRTTILGGDITLTTQYGSGNTNPVVADYAVAIDSNAHGLVMRDTRVIDADGVNGSIAFKVTGAVKGVQVEVPIYGFLNASDRIITFDAAATSGMRDCDFVFVHYQDGGTSIDTSTPANLVDIASGWDSSNSITFRNGTTGASVTLTPGTAY